MGDWLCARCGTRDTVKWWLALRAPAPGAPEVQVRLCDTCRRHDDE